MTGRDMTDLSLKLSAYLDGELPDGERSEVEDLLASDPQVQAEFDALVLADAEALAQFDADAAHPVSLDLVKMIKDTPLTEAAPIASGQAANHSRAPLWGLIAAALTALAIGGAGGYWLAEQSPQNRQVAQTATPAWLQQIAGYHAIYSEQDRHLVEVRADEADHIQNWLGKTVGTSFTIPDLSGFGLTFEGGRLLAANGKPVAQLMYRTATGDVIALCFQAGGAAETAGEFATRTQNEFNMISWSANGADFVVIGPDGFNGLADIATQASTAI